MSLQRGINLRALAEKMGQCSGAEVRGICTEAGSCSHFLICVMLLSSVTGMYALRERRQHVTQEDFEFAIAKVLKKNQEGNTSVNKLFS
jgi:26S proteasome regulatory subunit T6